MVPTRTTSILNIMSLKATIQYDRPLHTFNLRRRLHNLDEPRWPPPFVSDPALNPSGIDGKAQAQFHPIIIIITSNTNIKSLESTLVITM